MRLIKQKLGFGFVLLAMLVSGLMPAAGALAADEVTTRALKLYERHHYEEASHLLRPEWSKMEGNRQGAASLALGMIHLNNASMYRELQQTALAIELDYLTQLGKQKTGTSSRYVNFYLGQVLLEAGRPADAVIYFRRFIAKTGAKSPLKPYAEIELGIAYSRQKQMQNASRIWSGVDAGKPELKAALAGAYAVSGMQNKKPVAMADAAVTDALKQHYTPGPRMMRSLLRAYSQGGATDKALDLLNAIDLKAASYVEELGTTKTISFYDVGFLGDIARSQLDAAVMYFEKANQEARLSATATFYLAEAYLLQGNAEISLHTAATFLAQAQVPAQYGNMTRVQQAIAFSKTGQNAESAEIWQALSDKSAQDPELLTLLMHACVQAKADCVKIEKMSVAAVEKGDGKKYFPLNAALGKYYLVQKDYSKAVMYMEAGRDKAYKNKIEVNDPVMLTALAEAYYRSKKFSESLEIYFELGKEFPVVRQIQEAMQGIYAMEQQSAGEVKIF